MSPISRTKFSHHHTMHTHYSARHMMTISRTRMTVVFIGVMSILTAFPRLIDRIYHVEEDVVNGNMCIVKLNSWIENKYKEYYSIFFWWVRILQVLVKVYFSGLDVSIEDVYFDFERNLNAELVIVHSCVLAIHWQKRFWKLFDANIKFNREFPTNLFPVLFSSDKN